MESIGLSPKVEIVVLCYSVYFFIFAEIYENIYPNRGRIVSFISHNFGRNVVYTFDETNGYEICYN